MVGILKQVVAQKLQHQQHSAAAQPFMLNLLKMQQTLQSHSTQQQMVVVVLHHQKQ